MIFIRVPIQNAYGRRPVLIASTLICCISNVWRAVATSYQSEIGACALNGFGAGPAEVCFLYVWFNDGLLTWLPRPRSPKSSRISFSFTTVEPTRQFTLPFILDL